MKHDEILSQLVTNAENNSNILGFFVFGSVAKERIDERTGPQIPTTDMFFWRCLSRN
jgi:hypothetical protein